MDCYQMYTELLANSQRHASAAGTLLHEAAECFYIAEDDLQKCDDAVALLVAITDRLLGK